MGVDVVVAGAGHGGTAAGTPKQRDLGEIQSPSEEGGASPSPSPADHLTEDTTGLTGTTTYVVRDPAVDAAFVAKMHPMDPEVRVCVCLYLCV